MFEDIMKNEDMDENENLTELEYQCFNGITFSKFQLAANFFFENTFPGWLHDESVTYLIPPLFRCKSEGHILTSCIDGGVLGNIRGDENEHLLFNAFQKLITKPQIAFHSFRLRERLKTYNKLMLPFYQHRRNPFEMNARALLKSIYEDTRREDAECDFMVFDKHFGIFLFEVKSSLAGRADAKQQLLIDKKFVEVLIHNGFTEAGLNNGKELLETIPIHTYTVFPNLHRNDCSYIDEIYVDEINNFQTWWDCQVQHCAQKHGDNSNLIHLMTLLASRFVAMASSSPITINEAIAGLGETLHTQAFGKNLKKFRFMFFTPSQDSTLRHFSEKMVLAGPPGSGKSIVLQYKCLEIAKAKMNELHLENFKKILVICGNKAIGLKSIYKTFLRANLTNMVDKVVDVFTKEELDERHKNHLVLFDDNIVLRHMYCDIIIDELQSVYASLLSNHLKNTLDLSECIKSLGRTFHFVWFSIDTSQFKNIYTLGSRGNGYHPLSLDPNVWTISELPHTLRNTRNIAEEVSHFSHQDIPITAGHRIKGPSTQWIDVDEKEEVCSHKALVETIKSLIEPTSSRETLKVINSRLRTEEVLSVGSISYKDILVYWNEHDQNKFNNLTNHLTKNNILYQFLSSNYDPIENKITVANDPEEILSMEFRVVIVMFVRQGKEYEDESLVVPVGRAMCHLIMLRTK